MKAKTTCRFLATLLVTAMLLTILPTALAGCFPDVPDGAWYEAAVTYCSDNGLMTGTDKGFDPMGKVTREQTVQTLYAMADKPETAYSAAFADVAEGQWYTSAILWAVDKGITSGTGDGKFGVGINVTREQIALFLRSYAALACKDTSAAADLNKFPDNASADSWAIDALRWAVAEGFLSGKGAGDRTLLAPRDELTRAELAVILANFHKYIDAPAEEDLYTYTDTEEGICLTGYNGTEEAPQLPAEIDGKPVTAIGEGAFAGNLTLKTLTVPEGIISIADYAFECCPSLMAVTLPASMKSIGRGAFSGCVMLETADISDGLESIGDGAFFFCRRLKSISLPGTVKTVGNFIFSECSALSSATLGEGMTKVGERMFWGCRSLQSAKLPETIAEIGPLAFAKCEMLSSFAIPAGVTEIGAYAFDGCGSLTSLTFPAHTVREHTFRSCYSLESITLTDKVVSAEENAFNGATCMEDFTVPATLTDIAPGAFNGMNTPAYRVDEGNPNFRGEDGVILSKDGTKLFSYPAGKPDAAYEIPASVTTVAPYAFAGVYLLEELTIPASVTTLEDYAFYQLCNMPSFTLPSTVKTIGTHVFDSMNAALMTIEMPLTDLPEGTFMNSNSEKIILPETLETIGKDAFFCAGSMTELTLPKNLETIADGALVGTDCVFVSESENFKVENNALYTADGKTLIRYKNPFDNTEFTIPEGVETVAPYAIDSRSLSVLRVPASLKTVGEKGFGYQFYANSHGLEANAVSGLKVIGSASDEVRSYAAENHIGCFTAEPSQNVTELTLAGDETATFTVENADPADVSYSSFDSDIVSVAQDGTVTAHKQGKAEIFASVGFTVFKCTVTVTSDGTPNEAAFDAGKYRDLSADEVPAWFENYLRVNEGNILVDPDRNPFAAAYKGENYFEGIWAAQVEQSEYDAGAVDLFGNNFRPQLAMMGHGLKTELLRYEQPDDLVLYSGTTDFSRFIGKEATLKNLKESIGMTITEPFFFSTALQESVAPTFAGPYCSVFIIYADRELVEGGYIEGTVGQGAGGEYEILLTGGAKMEILDAGIREISVTDQWTGEVSTMNETYMKVRLVPKD